MDSDEFLQTSHPPETRHRPLAPSEWPLLMVCKKTTARQRVQILRPVIFSATRFLPIGIAYDFHRSAALLHKSA